MLSCLPGLQMLMNGCRRMRVVKKLGGLLLAVLAFNYCVEAIHLLSHSHVICPVHGEISHNEQAAVKPNSIRTLTQGPVVKRDTHGSADCDHCLVVLGLHNQKTVTSLPALMATKIVSEITSPHISFDSCKSNIAIYLSAPKNSPPA